MEYGYASSGGLDLTQILIIAGVVVLAMLTIGIILAKLYMRAPKDVAFVRTGMSGQKVIKDGGALKIPWCTTSPGSTCAPCASRCSAGTRAP